MKNNKMKLILFLGMSFLSNQRLYSFDCENLESPSAEAIFGTAGTMSACLGGYLGFVSAGKIIDLASKTAEFCNYKASENLSYDTILTGTSITLGALLGASLIKGVYNVRAQNETISDIESRYGLTPLYNWYQVPGEILTNSICYGVEEGNNPDNQYFSTIIKEITDRVDSIDYLNNNNVWTMGDFINKLPHIDQNKYYTMAQSFFVSIFGSHQNMGNISYSIDRSLEIIEADFDNLKKLTGLNNHTKMPKTGAEFMTFVNDLNQSSQSVVMNSYLGMFGYSGLHNGPRVKTCIKKVVQYHQFLAQLRSLVGLNCDGPDTMVSGQGVLYFAVQHLNENIQLVHADPVGHIHY